MIKWILVTLLMITAALSLITIELGILAFTFYKLGMVPI